MGIGTTSPLSGLHIDRPESGPGTALGVLLSGGSTGNPSIELRGDGKAPYIDFAEATGVDYTTRLISQGGVLNVNALAKAIETAKVKTPVGEMSMRAADHQALLPMVVSTVTKDAKYKADETDMGFKPVKLFSASDAATPAQASCTMQRPAAGG